MENTILGGRIGMNVKTYRSIAEVNEALWDAIVSKDQIFCTHRCIEAIEKSGISEGSSYYIVVCDGDEIIAHACVYCLATEVDIFAQGAIKKIINLIRRKWKNFFIARCLECGPPISVGSAMSFKDGVPRAEALRLICDEIERLAKELSVNLVLFRDFYDKELEFYDLLRRRGYMKIHNLPKAEVRIRWKTFDEYIDSMHSNYRRKIIKRMDKCARANISVQVLKDFSDRTREMKELHDNVYNEAKEIKRERMNESFFQNIHKYLRQEVAAILAVKDGRPIGYMLLFFSGKSLITKFPGLDYNYSKEYYIYFNLFYGAIKAGIEAGMEDIDLGITTLDPKKDMGADIVNLNMYIRHSNIFLNKIFPMLFSMIAPPDTAEPRNVFKDDR